MPHDLKDLFDQALDDEPVSPPGDPAAQARAQGRRIRRRRGAVAGGSVAAVVAAAVVGVNLILAPAPPPAEPLTPVAAAMMRLPGAESCRWPVQEDVDDVSIFLTETATEADRLALQSALGDDPRVRELRFESREEAYVKFQKLWRDSPDFVKSVSPAQLPESFRVSLADPSAYRDFEASYQGRSGIGDVIGRTCPGTSK